MTRTPVGAAAARGAFSLTPSFALAWPIICAVAIYLPDVGHGFIKDDYSWIATSRVHGPSDLFGLLTSAPMGFYRPLVSLTFAANHAISHLGPFAYGLTNLALTMAIAAATYLLIVRIGVPYGAAAFGMAVWLLNFHGINMAVLWISGRTSLLATLFAVLSAYVFLNARYRLAGVLLFASLLSKEEPVLLPLVLSVWWLIDRFEEPQPLSKKIGNLAKASWPLFLALAVYVGLREHADALTPASAPSFYKLSLTNLPANALQYADRSLTTAFAVLLLGLLCTRTGRIVMTAHEWRIAAKGLVWLVAGYAVTILVPVRSSLYACLPTIGVSLMAAAVGGAVWRDLRWPRGVSIALCVLPLALMPVYRARNVRLVKEAELGAQTLAVLDRHLSEGGAREVTIIDRPSERPSISDAFGNALPVAVRLFFPDAPLTTTIVNAGAPLPAAPGAVFTMNHGILTQASQHAR